MKRLISFILCALMLLSLVPATAFAASETEVAYDLPEPGDKTKVLYTNTVYKAYNDVTKKYYLLHTAERAADTAHPIIFRRLAKDNAKNYDPDIIFYCIQFGVNDTSSYTACKPAESEYWKGLPEIARFGILLSMGLGYLLKEIFCSLLT
jgi:hypothetical protein